MSDPGVELVYAILRTAQQCDQVAFRYDKTRNALCVSLSCGRLVSEMIVSEVRLATMLLPAYHVTRMLEESLQKMNEARANEQK